MKPAVSFALLWPLAACGLATPPLTAPVGDRLGALEAAAAADPTDVSAVAELAVGYVSTGRLNEARDVLATSLELLPRERTLLGLLGMVEYPSGDALASYRHLGAFLTLYPLDVAAREVAARRDAVRARAFEAQARERLTSESGLPFGKRVAVLPLSHSTQDEDLTGITVALADMIAGDLAVVTQVVDPAEVRAMLVAMGTRPDESMSIAYALRMGSLLGAGSVVYGTMSRSASGVTMDVTVLTFSGEEALLASTTLRGAVGEELRLQKLISFFVAEALIPRIRLREALLIGPREAANLGAVAAFGRGLAAAARGDAVAAVAEFDSAVRAQSDFSEAVSAAERARRDVAVESAPLLDGVMETARTGEMQRAVAALAGRPLSRGELLGARTGQRDRSLVPEVLSMDHVGAPTLFELVLSLGRLAP